MLTVPYGTTVEYGITIKSGAIDKKTIPFKLVGIEEYFFLSEQIQDDISAKNLAQNLVLDVCGPGTTMTFNLSPAHYAPDKNLQSIAQYDEDGNVEHIGGFSNPFVMMSFIISKNDTEIGNGSIMCQEFTMTQTMDEILTDTIPVH